MTTNKLIMITSDLSLNLNFATDLALLGYLCSMEHDIIWCNGGNCRIIAVNQIEELLRTVELFTKLDDELDIKKGPPPQHRIYWDDCLKVPGDLSQLLNNETSN